MDFKEVSRNGSLLRHYAYDAFGNRIGRDIYSFEVDNGIPEAAGQKPQNAERQMQPFGYTGYQMDAAGGLYFAQARRYDAENGRFISEDKIPGLTSVPFTLNHYFFIWI